MKRETVAVEESVQENEKTIQALEFFEKAHRNLVENWGNLNELESVSLYPFTTSFDEINVAEWVEESVNELSSKKEIV